jgi:hypothetical protein
MTSGSITPNANLKESEDRGCFLITMTNGCRSLHEQTEGFPNVIMPTIRNEISKIIQFSENGRNCLSRKS